MLQWEKAYGGVTMTELETLVRELPPELQSEVEDFVLFLLHKHTTQRQIAFRAAPLFDWACGLNQSDNQATSVDVQHQILQWRTQQL